MTTVGTTVRVDVSWTASTVAANPGTVSVYVEDPNGAVTSPSVTHEGTGEDHFEIPLTMAGRWRVRAVGTAPVPAAAETYIDVDDSPFVGR
jgi:hypothetical protein